ncbi:MAG: hypothetical protein ABF289_00505 [Clostridiales bacterium]
MKEQIFNGIDKSKLVKELEILKHELKKNKLHKEALNIKVAIEAASKKESELVLFLGYSEMKVLKVAQINNLFYAVEALKRSINYNKFSNLSNCNNNC